MTAVLALLAVLVTLAVFWEVGIMGYQFCRAARTRRLIPCDRCMYASHSPQLNQLKCTVHPEFAYTEQAIACEDFCAQTPSA
jgi:hypothetical protein